MHPNRQHLFSTIVSLTEHGCPQSPWLGLVIFDIRGFSQINRAYGFACGDALIEHVLDELATLCKNPNYFFHIGNDEFALLVPDMNSPSMISLAASRVADQLRVPFFWRNNQLALQINIGATAGNHISYSGESQQFVDKIILSAEQALLQAKDRNLTFHIEDFAAPQQDGALDLKLHADFRRALFENELELFYQPQAMLKPHPSSSAEALLRWQHPERGLILPNEMLPVCTQLGLNLDLTKWVIHTALRHIDEWPDESIPSISVNLFADIIDTFALPELIANSLKIWNIDPNLLTLEITESAVFNDRQTGFSNLSQLHDIGVNISIDDFGTGYSSLEYFRHIRANEIKIDRSFVTQMHNNKADRKLVKLIIDLAHSFDMQVVAEGVENQQVADILQRMGCDLAQGYHYAKPLCHTNYIAWNKSSAKVSAASPKPALSSKRQSTL